MNLQYLSFSRILLDNGNILRPYELDGDIADIVHHKSETTLDSYREVLSVHDDVDSVFEIGVASGGSLILWSLVFGCKVVGIDNMCGVTEEMLKYMGCRSVVVHFMDSLQFSIVEQCVGYEFPFGVDIIIDDGAHTIDAIKINVFHLFKFVKSGGLYFIEDYKALHPIHEKDLMYFLESLGLHAVAYPNFLLLRKQ